MDSLQPKTDVNAPARLAFCITELEPGGAERCLAELATRLDRQRFEPIVYCLGARPLGNPAWLIEKLESAGIVVHCFGARRVTSLPSLASQLKRQVELDRPRLMQTFLFHANVVGAWAARKAGVRHVVTGIRVAEKRAGWHLRLARWADRWVDRHVCVSQSVRGFSHTNGRLPEDKLVVIPNGVDLARFAEAQPIAPASLGRTGNRRLIACVGRLDAQKGLEWLLSTMPGIFSEAPGTELVLVGSGPLAGRLEKLTARLGIADRVVFAGYRDDVPEILAASELVVLPSRWEGMPNVVLEAMASGRPVVATDVAGVREALGDAAERQIADPDDPRAFAQKVAAILADREMAAGLGHLNQQRVSQHFTLAGMVDAYQRLYEGLLSAET